MSRRDPVTTAITLFLLYAAYRGLRTFFSTVTRKQLWIEFFISSFAWILINYLLIPHVTRYCAFCIVIPITTITYMIYWLFLFKIRRITRSSCKWLTAGFWRSLDPFDFEDEVADLFRAAGYKATVTQDRGDFGVDVVVSYQGVRTAIQCKRYNGHKVTCEEVQKLWGARDYYGCENAIMIGLDGATKSAKKFMDNFRGRYKFINIHDLIDYAELALSGKKLHIF